MRIFREGTGSYCHQHSVAALKQQFVGISLKMSVLALKANTYSEINRVCSFTQSVKNKNKVLFWPGNVIFHNSSQESQCKTAGKL